MERDLSTFNGLRLPYASELYGVFQPLIGWKSRLTAMRATRGSISPNDPNRVHVSGSLDSLVVEFPSKQSLMIDGAGDINDPAENDFAGFRLLPQPKPPLRFRTPQFLDSLLVRSIQRDVEKRREGAPTNDDPSWVDFWTAVLAPDELNARFKKILGHLQDGGFSDDESDDSTDPLRIYIGRMRSIMGSTEAGLAYIFDHELEVAATLVGLSKLADTNPTELAKTANGLLNNPIVPPKITDLIKDSNPFSLVPAAGREAVLSPVGVVQIFRQYFFELDNFLGPSVEHIWLAPGSRLELYEISTRKTIYEETTERTIERLLSSESSETNEDELSEAMRSEDSRNTKLGSTVSGGATVLVVHAEASGSLSVEETQRQAREETHRAKRQQSAKTAAQIRSNVKSVFRTVTETTDTRSKRYVIENVIGADRKPPKLRNYELRRKMRQVAVQMQDIGTQLCWQVFVDDPGRELGVGQLVHMAAKSDLSQYDEIPTKPTPVPDTDTMTILCPVPRPGRQSNLGPIAASGFLGLMAGSVPGAAAGVAAFEVLSDLFKGDGEEKKAFAIKSAWPIRQEFKVNLPPGYVIAPASEQDKGDDPGFAVNGEIPLKHIQNGRNIQHRMQISSASDGRLLLVVHAGNVTPGEMMEFQMRVTIKPTQAAIDAVVGENEGIKKDNAARSAERNRVIKTDFINGVRERVTLASKITKRPPVELREEERTVIYRALIRRLMTDAWSMSASRETAHLRSEFIRSIFDVDKMFYSVAPEWWQPRLHHSSQVVGAALAEDISPLTALSVANVGAVAGNQKAKAARTAVGVLGADETVGWGGEGRADNYMITETSAPARLGSSLGWLLQLDGDNLRNCMLNAPWVKAVIPIRPGKERAALEWLEQAKVEGSSGLNDAYEGDDLGRFAARPREDEDAVGPLTIREVLLMVAADIAAKNKKAVTPNEATGPDGELTQGILEPERVFQFGFEHLANGFKAEPLKAASFDIFDQWVEVVPTDQIVAVEVEYDPRSGEMI